MKKTHIVPVAALMTMLSAMPLLATEAAAETENDQVVRRTTTTTTTTAGGVTTTTTTVEEETKAEPALKVAPVGRILLDGGVFTSNEKSLFPAGVAAPDVRAGVKATYGKWCATVDIGFAYAKVSLKDIFIRHTFNPAHSLQVGYFIHQFGLQSASSSSMKISMEEPVVNEALNNPRLLGVMYKFDKGAYFATASLYAESKSMAFNTNQIRKTGYGGMTRLAWRPLRGAADNRCCIAQAGISFQAGSPQYNGDAEHPSNNVYSFRGNFPTRVNHVEAVGATVGEVSDMFKFTPELLLAGGPLALEAQYYHMRLGRKHGLATYSAYGAYGLLRCLVAGGDYGYSHAAACIADPKPRSLELVLGYSYTNTTHAKAGICGGRAQDLSLTANWYVNKYMIWRLRAAYTHRFDRTGDPDIDLGALQTRFQIIF